MSCFVCVCVCGGGGGGGFYWRLCYPMQFLVGQGNKDYKMSAVNGVVMGVTELPLLGRMDTSQ